MAMSHYYYLFYSLVFLASVVVLLVWRPDLKRKTYSALIWGAIGGPFIEIFDYRDYWQPQTLLGRGHISIEDVIFGASIAALAFLAYPCLAHKTLSESKYSSKKQLQLIIIYGAGAGVLFVLLLGIFHLNSVFATALVLLTGWLVEIWQRSDLRKPSLLVGVGFALGAFALYGVGISLVGKQALQNTWLLFGTSKGLLLLGKIPVSELVWFFAVGTFLSVFDLYTSGKVYEKHLHSGKANRPKARATASAASGKNDNT